jgi:hypothetical protein
MRSGVQPDVSDALMPLMELSDAISFSLCINEEDGVMDEERWGRSSRC